MTDAEIDQILDAIDGAITDSDNHYPEYGCNGDLVAWRADLRVGTLHATVKLIHDLANERDKLAGALAMIASGDGFYGQQAHEYKMVARRALGGGNDAE